MLLWKLAPGDANKVMAGKDPRPVKNETAGSDSWKCQDDVDSERETVGMGVNVPGWAMEELMKGHIPETMEDHWFMYFEDGIMRWYRSWTGYPVFEARCRQDGEDWVIDDMDVTIGIPEVPFTGPQSAGSLFMMLITAEAGANFWPFWDEYLEALQEGE